MMTVFEEPPQGARVYTLQPPSPERLRADLRSTRAEIDALLAADRAPTLTELADLRRKLTPIAAQERRPLPTFSERIRKLSRHGKRQPTGLPTIDRATRGGIPMGKRIILIGAPGASKTGLGLTLAKNLLAAGCHVAIHAADEDLDALLVRIGQTEKFCREDLEEGNVHALAKFLDVLERDYERLLHVDQEEDEWMLDDTIDELLVRGKGGPCVLFLDSIQTARVRSRAQHRSKREEIDAVVKLLKSASAKGILAIATSEMNRGAYKSRIAQDNVEDIASAAESRSIEFAAHMLITVKSVRDHEDLVDARIPKNRLGRSKPKFRLAINFDRATLEEVAPEEQPTKENETAKEDARKNAALTKLADQIYEAMLRQRAPITSIGQVIELVKGKSDDIRRAFNRLVNAGRVVKEEGKGKRGAYRVVSPSEEYRTPIAPQSHPAEGGEGESTIAPPNPRATTEGCSDGGAIDGGAENQRGATETLENEYRTPIAPQSHPEAEALEGWGPDEGI